MPDIETGRLIYLILLMAMVAGWFFMQSRQGWNKTLQQVAVWAMIFTGAAAGYGLWEDINRQGDIPRQAYEASTGSVTLPRARDGHYYLTATINGTPLRFVVDTGATDMVLTRADAEAAGLSPDSLNYLGRASTANGEVRTAYVRLDEVELGGVRDTDVPAVVNEGEMRQSLLGMGYLQRWGRIEITNGELILTR